MSSQYTTRQFTPVPFTSVHVEGGFWGPRLQTNRERTLFSQYRQLKETGRIDAFLLDWRPGKEPKPHYFWDSDVAKWLEAACYSLATHPDPRLRELVEEVAHKIVGAQQPDGYLNVYFTVVEPENRWKSLEVHHELYCAGHLMEAAVAHHQATGERLLLDAMIRYADYIDSVFGPDPGKRAGTCGHEEIELALVKLYHATGERRYLKLSQFFLDQRGQKPSVFQREHPEGTPPLDTSWCQDHMPVREQSEVVGHAVRAMYLYSAMADVAAETGDEALLQACQRLWSNLELKRMYVTGGVGSTAHHEGFTHDYDLPNDTAYCETCAAIGLVFWAHRMLQFEGDSRYADVMERALYNGVLSGVSLDGERYFYVNPLESVGNHHRQEWFGCACCPPNLARLLASLGGYCYSRSDTDLAIHLYVAGSVETQVAGSRLRVRQDTDYPWDGLVVVTVEPEKATRFALRLRLPGWCRGATVRVDGAPVDVAANLIHGYVRLEREWSGQERVELRLPMPVDRVWAHPAVRADAGLVALQRGPMVYCVEEVDHGVAPHRLVLPREAEVTAQQDPNLLGGVVSLRSEGCLSDDEGWEQALYRTTPPEHRAVPIVAIPYYAWDNREPGGMRVWLREG